MKAPALPLSRPGHVSRPKCWASARLPEWTVYRGPSLSGRGESHFLSKGLSGGVASNLPRVKNDMTEGDLIGASGNSGVLGST